VVLGRRNLRRRARRHFGGALEERSHALQVLEVLVGSGRRLGEVVLGVVVAWRNGGRRVVIFGLAFAPLPLDFFRRGDGREVAADGHNWRRRRHGDGRRRERRFGRGTRRVFVFVPGGVKHHVIAVDVSVQRLEVADGALELELAVVEPSGLVVVVHNLVVVVVVVLEKRL